MASSACFISIALLFVLICSPGCISHGQWARLTQQNFSSDIRDHVFVVTIATVPWCGESRSIMKELGKSIEEDQNLYPVVQLRVIYVNLEKDLAFTVIGRKKIPVITIYINAVRFQYNGALKTPNILAALHRGLAMSSGHFPFRQLKSISDVEKLLESTETAVMLYDICNYAEKLSERNWYKLVKKGMDNPKKFDQELSLSFPKEQGNEHAANVGKAEALQTNTHKIQLQQSCASTEGDDSQEDYTLSLGVNSEVTAVADRNDIVIPKRKSDNFLDNKSDFSDRGPSKMSEAEVVNQGVFSRTCGTSLLEYLWENSFDMFDQRHKFEVSTLCSYPPLDSHSCASVVTSFNHEIDIMRDSCDQTRSCNHTDYKHFRMLYQNLSRIVRAHVLTPEYVDFGIIRDKNLLLDLGVGKMQNFTWFLMVQTMNQLKAPNIYIETETMESSISDPMQLVPELKRDSAKHYASLIEMKPSLVLFIDRASPSLEIRKKSWDALRAVVSFVTDYKKPGSLQGKDIHPDAQDAQEKNVIIKSIDGNELFNTIANLKASVTYGALTDNIVRPTGYEPEIIKDNLGGADQNLHQEVDKHGNAMVLKVLLGDGNSQEKDMHSDAQEVQEKKVLIKSVDGSELFNTIADLKTSLNDGILTDNVLRQTGYQPEIIEDNISGTEKNLYQEVDKRANTMVLKVSLGNGKPQIKESLSEMTSEKFQALAIKEALFLENNAFLNEGQHKKQIGELDLENLPSFLMGIGSKKMNMQLNFDDVENRGMKKHVNLTHVHSLSYFRVDGDDSIKDMLLQNVPYPSLVLLDPSEGGHFVFPVDWPICYSSIKEFLYQFSRGSLKRMYNSGREPLSPRKQVKPPFVNRDFREMNGVPRITVEMLSEMLVTSLGPDNDSDLSKRGILVHFTLSACGFCKKMELVFREVHQLLTLHMDAHLKSRCFGQNENGKQADCVIGTCPRFPDKASCAHDLWSEWKDKLPILFQIDCMTNDCSLFFKDVDQESYPSILLFSPERKVKMFFNGGPSVQQVLEFIIHEGSIDIKILHMLHGQWRFSEELKFKTRFSASSEPVQIDSHVGPAQHIYHCTTGAAEENPSCRSLGTQTTNVAVNDRELTNSLIYPKVGSVLVATKKLNAKISKIFDNSRIWIVKADGQEGFQGLIINKPLSSLDHLVKAVGSELGEIFNGTVLCYGGPIIVNGQPFVSLTRLKDIEGYLEVVPGIYFGGTLATMQVLQSIKEAKKFAVTDFWFFLGYSAWSWQQLLDEVEANLWQLNSYGEENLSGTIQKWQNSSYLDISQLMVVDTMRES